MKIICKPIVLLVVFFLMIAGTICLRVYVEETSYTSPDSKFYLKVAQNLISGKGAIAPIVYPFDETTEEQPFCMWPIGYPVLVAGLGKVIGDVFVASKLINIIFIGFCLALFYYFYHWKGAVMGLVFCFYGVLEVYSYTWSEGVFLFGLLVLWQLLLYQYKNKITTPLLMLGVSIVLSFLFLIRYAGIVYIPFVFLVGCYYGLNQVIKKMWELWLSLLIPSLVVIAYFYYNFKNSGSMTGSDRVFPFMESLGEFTLGLLQGLINEFSIARNYYYRNYTDYLYMALLLLQILVICFVVLQVKKQGIKWEYSVDSKLLFMMSIFYLVAIIILRKISPFDPFNYRILAPFSFLFWIAILLELTQSKRLWKKIRVPIILFSLLSLFMNLPKVYLWSLL